jgi:hypothetical protein
MDRPGCHAYARCVVVSVYLATLADAAPLPRCPGVSTRALRASLRMMCRIAQSDGTMRYGLRASKLAKLCEYSVATIHRAERSLVEGGYVERVQVGGGRSSTRWRVAVDKLVQFAPKKPEHTTTAQPPEPVEPSRSRRWAWPSSKAPVSTIVTTVCPEHGGDGGQLHDGTPRCPQCRRRRDSVTTGPAP